MRVEGASVGIVDDGTDEVRFVAPEGEAHVPVLPREVLAFAAVRPGCTVVDGTFGAGGHARLLATAMDGRGTYVGIDRDPAAGARFDRFAGEWPTLDARFIPAPFPDGFELLAGEGVSADVVILDVGVSSMQIDEPERGFSYMRDGPLDMRMDTGSGQGARDLVATADEQELVRILRELGEERYARRIARAIIARRADRPIETTGDLAAIVESAVPAVARRSPGHPAMRTFQALRIAVNDELGMLRRGLTQAFELLAPGGRIVTIAFHSLEDRIVKQQLAAWAGQCTCPPGLPVCGCGAHARVEVLSRKVVRAREDELAANPRSASARLRAARRLEAVT